MYPIIFIDAIHFSVREDGIVRKLAAYIVLGINENGMIDVLTIEVGENESSKYWLSILNSLKNCGVQDILILCSDGLTGLKEAIATAYPRTEHQQSCSRIESLIKILVARGFLIPLAVNFGATNWNLYP